MEKIETETRKTVRSADEKKTLISRVNRIVGQMNGIRKMIEEDRYCEDVLVQLSAVYKAVKSLSGIILARHMHCCIAESVKNGDEQAFDEVVELFKRFE